VLGLDGEKSGVAFAYSQVKGRSFQAVKTRAAAAMIPSV
jgi:hypothetical protein